jgi:hypothetical protein
LEEEFNRGWRFSGLWHNNGARIPASPLALPARQTFFNSQEVRMKVKTALLVLLALVALVASGCGIAQGLLGRNAGTVSQLWSDVPALPNGTKSNIDIPLPVQIAIQGFMQAANSDSSSSTKLDKFDFIAYQTAQTPQQITDYYTADKMKAAGWDSTDTPGCTSGTGTSAVGFCVFGKKGTGGKQTVLLIIPAQDDTTKQTQVFFVRFEATNKTP